ncbi:MAG: hypothetical protein EBU90_23130 [Proteobacteria bacterium]|nr:hypothetical protein [Pseudomonadota bacterium]NBP15200.1 hypothetical protein [bacterium]
MLKKIIGLVVIIAAGFAIKKYVEQPKKFGTVIVLNGPSASGKTSLQKAFQKIMAPDLWIKVGIDNLFDKPMPDIEMSELARWQSPNSIRWVTTTQDKDNHNVVTLYTGVEGEKVAYGMNSAIAGYAQAGCNVIVDYIAYKKEWLEDLQQKLAGIKTYYIAVKIPLATLEQREKDRATSPVGHARSHYETVYSTIKYDLELQVEQKSSEELAKEIKKLIELINI